MTTIQEKTDWNRFQSWNLARIAIYRMKINFQ